MAEKLVAVFEKLSGLLPSSITLRPEEMFSQFSFIAPPAMPISDRTWASTVKALQSGQCMEILYKNRDGEKTAQVTPVHLANLHGDWYLFVQYEGFDNFRQLALSRIKKIKLLNKKMGVNGTFNPEKELSGTFSRFAGENHSFEVVIKFDPEIAHAVMEREWHPKQTVKTLENGSIELCFEAKGDIEVKRWVMAFGRYAEIKKPKWLKEQVFEEIKAMESIYQ